MKLFFFDDIKELVLILTMIIVLWSFCLVVYSCVLEMHIDIFMDDMMSELVKEGGVGVLETIDYEFIIVESG